MNLPAARSDWPLSYSNRLGLHQAHPMCRVVGTGQALVPLVRRPSTTVALEGAGTSVPVDVRKAAGLCTAACSVSALRHRDRSTTSATLSDAVSCMTGPQATSAAVIALMNGLS